MSEEEAVKEAAEEAARIEAEKEEENLIEESPVKVQARLGGWTDKEEWVEAGNDPDEWRSAREFNERGELFRKISNFSKRNKQLEKGLKDLAEHNQKLAEYDKEKVISDLKSKKTEAMKDNDYAQVTDIDEEILRVRSMQAPKVEIEEQDTASQQQWLQNNPWFNTDQELKEEASILASGYSHIHPNEGNIEALNYAAKEIRKKYPAKFRSTVKSKVEPGGTRPGKTKSTKYPKLSELPFEMQKTARNLAELGALTTDEYIKQQVDSGVIIVE